MAWQLGSCWHGSSWHGSSKSARQLASCCRRPLGAWWLACAPHRIAWGTLAWHASGVSSWLAGRPPAPPSPAPPCSLACPPSFNPAQVGQLNEELDKLVAIAGTWKNEDAAKRQVSEDQAAVLRGLMQVRLRLTLCFISQGGSGRTAAALQGIWDERGGGARMQLHTGQTSGGAPACCSPTCAPCAAPSARAEDDSKSDEVDRPGWLLLAAPGPAGGPF